MGDARKTIPIRKSWDVVANGSPGGQEHIHKSDQSPPSTEWAYENQPVVSSRESYKGGKSRDAVQRNPEVGGHDVLQECGFSTVGRCIACYSRLNLLCVGMYYCPFCCPVDFEKDLSVVANRLDESVDSKQCDGEETDVGNIFTAWPESYERS